MAKKNNRADLYKYASSNQFHGKPTEQIFTQIMENRLWEETDTESVSGPGSATSQTQELAKRLPDIFRGYGVKKLLDAPCGDFNWMQKIDLSEIEYIGGDIVKIIIEKNSEKYTAENISFLPINLIENIPGGFDMLFCRDCLVHLSFNDIFKVLENIKKSKITYLMTTTFPQELENKDIATGDWRPINLLRPPFNFPEPIFLLNEKCTEMNGAFKDKSMGIWQVGALS